MKHTILASISYILLLVVIFYFHILNSDFVKEKFLKKWCNEIGTIHGGWEACLGGRVPFFTFVINFLSWLMEFVPNPLCCNLMMVMWTMS